MRNCRDIQHTAFCFVSFFDFQLNNLIIFVISSEDHLCQERSKLLTTAKPIIMLFVRLFVLKTFCFLQPNTETFEFDDDMKCILCYSAIRNVEATNVLDSQFPRFASFRLFFFLR